MCFWLRTLDLISQSSLLKNFAEVSEYMQKNPLSYPFEIAAQIPIVENEVCHILPISANFPIRSKRENDK